MRRSSFVCHKFKIFNISIIIIIDTPISGMNNRRSFVAVVVHEGLIYAIGGQNKSVIDDTIEVNI